MKTKILGLILVGFTIFSNVSVQAADEKHQMSEEMKAKMAKAKELGTPGAEHAVLKAFEGDWVVTNKSWMKPDEKPMESSGTASMEWILDGRFLKQSFKGNWAGESFKGMGLIGYDKIKKEYISFWMDNMSTGVFQSTGQYDASTKTFKDSGHFSCPMPDERDKWFRTEWKILNPNKHIYTMFTKDPDGKEFKSMELVYKRAK